MVAAVDLAGLSYAEAASALGVPRGTVMSRLFRARARLAGALGRQDERTLPDMIRPLLVAIAGLAIAAPAASAHDDASEIFATNNTAVITDEHDSRLGKRLNGFARRVERIVSDGGARPRGSALLDGVFFDSALGTTTFERSRVFEVDRASDDELRDIAETVRRRFLQGSVLTFDPRAAGDAVELDVPHVTAGALRKGLLADSEAQERLFGGSVTQDDHLLLVADRGDEAFARAFAKTIGGDLKRADTRYGDREFVSAATDGRARIEKRTLVLAAGDGDDVVALHDGRRVQIDFGEDGVVDFEVAHRRFDRVRVDGEGHDRLVVVRYRSRRRLRHARLRRRRGARVQRPATARTR